MTRRVYRCFLAAFLAGFPTSLLPAQDGQPDSRPADAAREQRPIRVGIIGASVSGGFVDITDTKVRPPNSSFTLKQVLRELWPSSEVRIRDTTSGLGLAMFLQPLKYGKRQIKLLQRRKPQLVIGVDFVFWFGYGPHGYGEAGQKRRLELQQKGLKLLEGLDGKILLGDYPDMTGAAARMLPPRFVPKPETQKKLNDHLHAWAKKRKNVVVFPLSKFVHEAKTTTQVLSYGSKELSVPKLYLLQSDRLHATRLGMAVLVHRLGDELPELLGRDHVLTKPDFSLPNLVQKLEIEDQLPDGPQ
ncbi:MAG: hypothetical protein ACYST0_10530 [Planctomycetota bacterium]|jgi:hypothetical protein